MAMTEASTLLRLCFVVLFGAMSLMHGPVMTYFGAHAEPAVSHDHAGHAGDDTDRNPAPAMQHVECNSFACFLAVDPLPPVARPLHPVLFAILTGTTAARPVPVRAAPDLPPPRLPS
jgi:hypothetical protein